LVVGEGREYCGSCKPHTRQSGRFCDYESAPEAAFRLKAEATHPEGASSFSQKSA